MTVVDLAAQQRQYALRLAADYGFAVFPVDHPSHKRCRGVRTKMHDPDSCAERGKHPTCKWSEWSTADVEQLAKPHYFGAAANIGVDCGKSRLLVVDEDELGAFTRFCAGRGVEVPVTFTVRTGKGHHYYFRQPSGRECGNREGAFHDYPINIRGVGGYVVGPGSLHHTGVVYAAVGDCRDIAPAPDWLLAALDETPAASTGGSGSGSDWWRSGPIPPSKRHKAMAAAAGWCRRMGLTYDEAIPTMRDVYSRLEGDRYTWQDCLARLDDIYHRYPAGYRLDLAPFTPAGAAPDGNGDQTVEVEEARQRALSAAIANEAFRLRVRREAARIVDNESRPATPDPEILTLTERLARPHPPTLWRIEGWQPADSRIVLAAQYKAGKTTLVGNLTRSLVDGDPWLGVGNVNPVRRRVVILDTEMGARQLDGWLADQRITNTDKVVPIPLRGHVAALDLLNPDRRREWADRLAELGCDYLILDPLKPVLDALGLDEHRDAGRFLVPFDELLVDAGIPDAAVVHHMGHTAERSRGDSRIRDWPDVEWRLVREDPDNPASTRYLSAFGRDVDIPESRVDYDPVTRRLTLVGGSRRDRDTNAALDAVLEFLTDNPGQSGRKIEEAVSDHPRSVVRAAVKAGIGSGTIVVEQGPQRSRLHSINPVRRSAPPVRRRTESECASAPIGGALHSLTQPRSAPPATPAHSPTDDQPADEWVKEWNAAAQSRAKEVPL